MSGVLELQKMQRRRSRSLLVAFALVMLGSCTGVSQPALTPASTPSSGPPTTSELVAPAAKLLRIGVQREPRDGIIAFAGNQRAGGAHNARDIAHNDLVITNEGGELEPQLAAEVVSVDRGSWKLNADGNMETVWKIRPNVFWHDGTPFTAEDLVFSVTVKKDSEIPWTSSGRPELMDAYSAPDPLTFVVHWSAPYFRANEAPDIVALPRHLLESRYREDKASFLNSPWFTSEFIGLGPYKVERWEPGSHIEFSRFDAYYQGRAPFDTVVLRFLGDPNTMIANALSGDVDLLLPLGVEIEGGAEVQRRWQGTGNQVKFLPQEFLWQVQIQHRPEYSRPTNGFTVRGVRQGFLQSIDRQTLVEVVTQGLAPIADSWFPPDDALRPQLADAIPQFPYDPTRAQQLLAEAGWTRGPDGVLVHGQTGERFEVELRGNQAGALDSQMNVIADGWKAVGAQVNFNVVPTARVSDAEYAAQFPGGYVWFLGAPSLTENRLHSRQIATASNRWAARNRVGYNNPRVDSLLDRLVTTIDAGARLQLHRELLQEQMGDVAIMPLYWDVAPLIMAKGVSGPIGGGGRVIPNFFGWRKD